MPERLDPNTMTHVAVMVNDNNHVFLIHGALKTNRATSTSSDGVAASRRFWKGNPCGCGEKTRQTRERPNQQAEMKS